MVDPAPTPPPSAPGTLPAPNALADLAAALTAPPPVSASVLKGVVTAVALTGTPPTISVNLAGDTTVTVAAVRFVDSYTPVTGDTVLLVKQGADIFALGQMNDSNAGVSNGWQTPSLSGGVSTNGNGNGAVQYRVVVDNGDNKVQLKGSVAVSFSGSPMTLWSGMSGVYVPSATRSVVVAVTGALTASVDFGTDGTVKLNAQTSGSTSNVNASGTTGSGSGTTGTGTASGDTGSTSGNHTHSTSGGTSSSDPGGNTGNTSSNHTHNAPNGATDGQSSDHHHNFVANHSHSYSDTTDGQSSDHHHAFNDGGHTHSGGGHTHSFDDGGHAHTTSVTTPTWVSFNGVEYFL
jgi:hypothetical protein